MEDKQKKGLWSEEEDRVLVEHIQLHGVGKWNRIPKLTGLKRCGKSCRLRWLNYLCPNIKRGCFSEEEDDLIIRLHKLIGNRWSLIAGRVPGRTDNQVKNYWNSHLSKKIGINSSSTKKSPRTILSPQLDQNSIPINNNNNTNNNNNNLSNTNVVISTDMDGDKVTDPVQEDEFDLTDNSSGGNIFLESSLMTGDDNINYCDYFFNFEDYDNILDNVDGHCLDLFDLGIP